jgi:hypothetical protein
VFEVFEVKWKDVIEGSECAIELMREYGLFPVSFIPFPEYSRNKFKNILPEHGMRSTRNEVQYALNEFKFRHRDPLTQDKKGCSQAIGQYGVAHIEETESDYSGVFVPEWKPKK